jgi:hypothetical protein
MLFCRFIYRIMGWNDAEERKDAMENDNQRECDKFE